MDLIDYNIHDVSTDLSSKYIPWVMNALYDSDSFNSVTLEEIRDAFRLKQMASKSWMLDSIDKYIPDRSSKVLVIGSWIGFTSFCLWKMGFTNITECDPDTRLEHLAKHLNRFNKNFTHISDDVNNLDIQSYDLIINTSCEHIKDNSWFEKISSGTKLLLHSNNLPGYDHVNTCENLNEMISKYPMELMLAGQLDLDQYIRFMLIGVKTD